MLDVCCSSSSYFQDGFFSLLQKIESSQNCAISLNCIQNISFKHSANSYYWARSPNRHAKTAGPTIWDFKIKGFALWSIASESFQSQDVTHIQSTTYAREKKTHDVFSLIGRELHEYKCLLIHVKRHTELQRSRTRLLESSWTQFFFLHSGAAGQTGSEVFVFMLILITGIKQTNHHAVEIKRVEALVR